MKSQTKNRSFLVLSVILFGAFAALPGQSGHTNGLFRHNFPALKRKHANGEARDILISPDPDFVCPGNGVWSHPVQCELYYTCYLNEPTYLWKCRDNLLFDLPNELCNYSGVTFCGDRVRPNFITNLNTNLISADNPTDPNFTCPDNGFFPLSPNACSTTFYNCVGGVAYIDTCPGEGVFDPVQRTCVSSDQAECTQTTTTISTTNPGPNTCTEDGFFPLSPEACCSEYVNCFAGVAYITTCPGGGVFDPNLRICLSADAADCGFVCLAQDGFYDVPDECSNRYFACVEGVAYESFCPGNAIFDPDRLVCAAPESVSCYLASTTTISTSVTTASSTIPNENITTTTFSPPVEFVCPTTNGLYPNPDDCKTFYQCTGGKPYLKTCPNGLYFNPETLVCDYLDNVPSCQV